MREMTPAAARSARFFVHIGLLESLPVNP